MTPEEKARVKIDQFKGLPTLNKKGLRDCQYEAVTELEKLLDGIKEE